MSEMNIDQILSQMRALRSQAASGRPQEGGETASVAGGDEFATLLRRAIDGVNGVQMASSQLKARFEAGERDVDLTQVMIADQKASLAFTAVKEVRNKLVKAYQDIMSMPI